ncbi:hypothetical protein [Streptomyces sp. NPDC049590]|uniref:endonuclease/exonuclease/phosphatase family protein n=1 Tax=Streptomyces sp. NPDC049590 TaxID=3154834 RepID=UPI00342A1D7C
MLTEISPTRGGDALVTALADRGYATIIAPQPPDRDYRTVIACRTPAQQVHSPVLVTPHRAPAARVTVGGHDIGVLGLYVPSRGPKTHRNIAKRAFQDAVTKALPQLGAAFPGMPVIVAGDLNVIERGHQPPHSDASPRSPPDRARTTSHAHDHLSPGRRPALGSFSADAKEVPHPCPQPDLLPPTLDSPEETTP